MSATKKKLGVMQRSRKASTMSAKSLDSSKSNDTRLSLYSRKSVSINDRVSNRTEAKLQ